MRGVRGAGRSTGTDRPGRHRVVRVRRPSRSALWFVAGLAAPAALVASSLVSAGPVAPAPVPDVVAGPPPAARSAEGPVSSVPAAPMPPPPVSPPPVSASPVSPSAGATRGPTVRRAPRVPEQGTGRFTVVPGPGGARSGTTYRVEVEGGLPVSSTSFARVVRSTIQDGRGWSGSVPGGLVESGRDSDFRIVLASPRTTDRLCAPLETRGRVSCRNGDDVVINAWRWVRGAETYRGDLPGYRRYLVNHEVGHRLGEGHVGCAAPGARAPVMLQQTLGLQGCRRSSWPSEVERSSR